MSRRLYRFLALLSIVSILLVGSASPARATLWRDKVDPWVLQSASQGDTEFLVSLTSQADLSAAKNLATKSQKGWYVYRTLTSLAKSTQAPLVTELERLGVEYRSFWVTNVIWARADLQMLQQLASRPDVAHIYANPSVKLDIPARRSSSASSPQAVEWNITKVGAPGVWALGYTGQGVIIGGADTGYAWDHPAIKNKYRGWDGSIAVHDYNWFDATASPSPVPVDPYGHGTHTMGTMVGDDGLGNQIGMAPGARWIGCRNMDAGGNGTPASYIACFQWFIAPTRVDGTEPNPSLAPDVINNSWYCSPLEGCTDPNILLQAVQSLVAAGIVSATSAGNSGYYGCSSIDAPPAIYDESFTVGATNINDSIASFSSRGPVDGRIQPDVSAPGVDVRSSVPGGGYALMSGTSMAGPHVAGLVALLISAQPALRGQVDEIETTIEQNAHHIPWTGCSSNGVPNNAYGWGRIDALAAVQALHQIELGKIASVPFVMPGDLITYTLSITHENALSPTTSVVLTDTIPAGTSFVSATEPYAQNDDTVEWGFASLAANEQRSVNLTVMVDITTTGEITNTDYLVSSDQVAPVYGPPVVTHIKAPVIMEMKKSASAHLVDPGAVITYTISLTNLHDLISITNIVLTDTLPISTSFISATAPYTRLGDVIRWDFSNLDPLGTASVNLIVKVDYAAVGEIVNQDYAVRSDQVEAFQGYPVRTMLWRTFFLPLAVKGL